MPERERATGRSNVRRSPASEPHRGSSAILKSQSGLVDLESLPKGMIGIRVSNDDGVSGRIDVRGADLERAVKQLRPRAPRRR